MSNSTVFNYLHPNPLKKQINKTSITYFNLTRECLVQSVTILENHGSKTRKLGSKVTFESNFASTAFTAQDFGHIIIL